MSGKFVCGMRKFDQHKMMAKDRPTNQALFNENKQSLNDLIKLREEQDKGLFKSIPQHMMATTSVVIDTSDKKYEMYTPWKTPSSSTN